MRKFTLIPGLVLAVSLACAPASAPAGSGTTEGHAGHMAQEGTIGIHDGWVRPNLPNRPTAAYLSIVNQGEMADTLTGARSPQFEKVEIHISRHKDGVMTMSPAGPVEIAPGGRAEFKPGGLHLMMFGATDLFRSGDSVMLELQFHHAGAIHVELPVAKAAPAGHGDHSGHSGHTGHSSTSGN